MEPVEVEGTCPPEQGPVQCGGPCGESSVGVMPHETTQNAATANKGSATGGSATGNAPCRLPSSLLPACKLGELETEESEEDASEPTALLLQVGIPRAMNQPAQARGGGALQF